MTDTTKLVNFVRSKAEEVLAAVKAEQEAPELSDENYCAECGGINGNHWNCDAAGKAEQETEQTSWIFSEFIGDPPPQYKTWQEFASAKVKMGVRVSALQEAPELSDENYCAECSGINGNHNFNCTALSVNAEQEAPELSDDEIEKLAAQYCINEEIAPDYLEFARALLSRKLGGGK